MYAVIGAFSLELAFMKNVLKYALKNLNIPHSLKSRLVTVLLLSSLIPLILVGSVSYYTIAFVMKNNVENGIQSNLRQVETSIENTFANLDYVSKQLAFEGNLASRVAAFREGSDNFDKYMFNTEIKDGVNLIINTNPNIGEVFYYFNKTDEKLFANFPVKGENSEKERFDVMNLPVLSNDMKGSYFGPHVSAKASHSDLVFSTIRKMDSYILDDCYVYAETNYKMVDSLLDSGNYPVKAFHLLTDSSGKIVYGGVGKDFPLGTKLALDSNLSKVQEYGSYYFFNAKSSQGWNIYAVVNKQYYDRAVNQWLLRFILFGSVSLLLSFLFAILIWSMVYRPLRNINKEIMLMSENKFSSRLKPTRIFEFDELLNKFGYMREKVVDLLNEVERKEKLKSQLELEKLMYQINPHFLHNSLNCVQWLARANGQTEIVRLVALLTKVLHYNLGKEGGTVSVGDEIDALRSYVELQKIRYDYQFEVRIHAEEEALTARVPRFIMQPLVENAIYHGLNGEEGLVCVEVTCVEGNVRISVKDNGVGMDEKEIGKILDEDMGENKKAGMGIGLSYVNKMIKVYYGDKARMFINSKPGNGTEFIIEIPYVGSDGITAE